MLADGFRQRIKPRHRSRRASAGNSTRSGDLIRRTVRRSVHGENQRTRQAEHTAFRYGEEVTEDKDNGIAKIVLAMPDHQRREPALAVRPQVDLKPTRASVSTRRRCISNGQRGVYVKYGNLQRFLKITTLYENDSYILVPEDGKLGSANEVRLLMRSSCRHKFGGWQTIVTKIRRLY